MFELKKHCEQGFTKILDFLILNEFGIIVLLTWKLQPPEQVVKSLSVFFDSKPNTNQDKVIVIIMCIFSSFVIRPLSDWVTPTVDLDSNIILFNLKSII